MVCRDSFISKDIYSIFINDQIASMYENTGMWRFWMSANVATFKGEQRSLQWAECSGLISGIDLSEEAVCVMAPKGACKAVDAWCQLKTYTWKTQWITHSWILWNESHAPYIWIPHVLTLNVQYVYMLICCLFLWEIFFNVLPFWVTMYSFLYEMWIINKCFTCIYMRFTCATWTYIMKGSQLFIVMTMKIWKHFSRIIYT